MKMMSEPSREKLIAELTSYFRSNKETAGFYATEGAHGSIEINTPQRRIGAVSLIEIRGGDKVWHAHDFVNSSAQNATEDVLVGEYTINE